MDTLGIHAVCELSGCKIEQLRYVHTIRDALNRAVKEAKLTVLNQHFHQFHPTGVTALLSLAESHLSIHTWPEKGYAAIDAYTCGDKAQPERAIAVIADFLGAKKKFVRLIDRGISTAENEFENRERVPLDEKRQPFLFKEVGDDSEEHMYTAHQWLCRRSSAFQDIAIFRNSGYGKMLFLDGASQSAELDEYIYHEALIHPALTLHQDPRSVLILGGGEGASLREVLKHKTIERAVMIDIDEELVTQCRAHLPEWSNGAFEDPRACLVFEDGKEWVERNQETFDLIVMDLTDYIDEGASFPLYTVPFLELLKQRLNQGGILLLQAGEMSVAEFRAHKYLRKLITPLFQNVESYLQYIPTFRSEWSFIIASDSRIHTSQLLPSMIDKRLMQRVKTPLSFYDGTIHQKMFTISKDLLALTHEPKDAAPAEVHVLKPTAVRAAI